MTHTAAWQHALAPRSIICVPGLSVGRPGQVDLAAAAAAAVVVVNEGGAAGGVMLSCARCRRARVLPLWALALALTVTVLSKSWVNQALSCLDR